MPNESTLVYSSENGLIATCKNSGKVKANIQKNNNSSNMPSDGVVRLCRQTKGRGGGSVIVITGLPLDVTALKNLAGELKKQCGCGGTIKDGVIEIQGDHREILQQKLIDRGYRVKLAGG